MLEKLTIGIDIGRNPMVFLSLVCSIGRSDFPLEERAPSACFGFKRFAEICRDKVGKLRGHSRKPIQGDVELTWPWIGIASAAIEIERHAIDEDMPDSVTPVTALLHRH